jgi:AcrR family transcriptional regulator
LPTPARTSRAELIAIALGLIEAGGIEALTVSAVAKAAGIRGPSIYKHFADRLALLKAVEMEVLGELEAVLRAGTKGRTALQRLKSMAATYRRFALGHPNRYEAIYTRNAANDPELAVACLAAAQPLFEELRQSGIADDRIRPLSRTLAAFLHGFVSMEIVNAFRLGGDLERDFADSLDTILSEIR